MEEAHGARRRNAGTLHGAGIKEWEGRTAHGLHGAGIKEWEGEAHGARRRN